jgi:hypothetical protein
MKIAAEAAEQLVTGPDEFLAQVRLIYDKGRACHLALFLFSARCHTQGWYWQMLGRPEKFSVYEKSPSMRPTGFPRPGRACRLR